MPRRIERVSICSYVIKKQCHNIGLLSTSIILFIREVIFNECAHYWMGGISCMWYPLKVVDTLSGMTHWWYIFCYENKI